MEQDHSTKRQIRDLIGPVPEAPVPPALDRAVHARALAWTRQRRAAQEGLSVPLWGKAALVLIALELAALLYTSAPALDIAQFIRTAGYVLAGLNALALLTSPVVLLHRQQRKVVHE